MAVPRNPIVIDTSDTFSTWLSNTNLAINVLKNIITDTILTHPGASAFTVGSTITQATTGATGIVQVSTTGATTLSDLGTGTWGTSNDVTQSAPTSVTVSAGDIDAVTTSHLATTDAVLTTPTITAPVIATITNNSNTLTLPTSADTIVGRATTDTLTNKTLTAPAINGGTITSATMVTPTLGTVANITIANAGNIGSASDTDAMSISSGGVVTFSQRDVHSAGITIADAGTIGSASTAAAITIASTGIVTLVDDLVIKDGGTIGVTSAATAITIAATGIVTLVDDLVIKDGGTIGVTSAATAITISSAGIVTLVDDLVIKDGGTIGVTSAATAITIAATGIVTFVDDIIIKDAGTIGSATDPDAIAIGSDGDVTLTQDLELQHDGATISLGTNDDVVITHVADTGLIIKNTHTSGNSGIGTVITLQTGDTDVADGNILGQIKFQAPDEGSGSADQDLVAAGIAARAEGDFSDTNNATELVFNTGLTEDATIGATGGDMILSSAGRLNLLGDRGGLYVYSNEDADADEPLVDIRADNTAFDQATVRIQTDSSTADSLQIYNAGLSTRRCIFGGASYESSIYSESTITSLMHINYGNVNDVSNLWLKTDVANASTRGKQIIFEARASNGVVGSITSDGDDTAYVTSSDYRLKENIINMTGAITKLKNIKARQFNWIKNPDAGNIEGFIAHELAEVCPQAVSGIKDAMYNHRDSDGELLIDPQGVDYGRITPILVAALQEAIARIEVLESA